MADVIAIGKKKENRPEEDKKEPSAEADFQAIEKLNKEKKERLAKERKVHNENVTRQYRLK